MSQIHALNSRGQSDVSGFEEMRAKLAYLREGMVAAWQERAVTLTRDERAELKSEIEATASLLSALSRIY